MEKTQQTCTTECKIGKTYGLLIEHLKKEIERKDQIILDLSTEAHASHKHTEGRIIDAASIFKKG